MPAIKKIVIVLILLSQAYDTNAQHPNWQKIDSLKMLIPKTKGIQRIDCLNKLCVEYWWPPRIYPDSIYGWASLAYKESVSVNYSAGTATSLMLFGVADIYRKNFSTAEKYLRQALGIFQTLQDDFGLGWTYVWLGQSLYSQNDFAESLLCYEKSLAYLERLGDWDGEAKAWAWMGGIYANLGNYDSSYFFCSKSMLIRKKMSDYSCVAYAYTNMGNLFRVAGSYSDALDYTRQGFHYANTHGVDMFTADWIYFEAIGTIYRSIGMPDSSYYYVRKALQNDSGNLMTRISFAESLLMKNQSDSALAIFLKPVDHFRKESNRWDLMRLLLDIAKAYERKNENKTALPYALEGFSLAQKAGAKQFMLDGYQLLSRLYKELQVNDSAYYFLDQYAALKDSIVNNQFLWKLSNYKKQEDFKKQLEQVAQLDKENKAGAEKLKQVSLLKTILLVSLFVVILVAFVVYKNIALKGKNEKLRSHHQQAMLQQHATELEMQALRSQMNPHFIFNCLSSINSFILKNQTEDASDYLTKFSRLIRMVLSNSNKTFITLEEELDMLKLYLDMERLRFKNSFDYNIIFANDVDEGNVCIPPLLLQPFVENAIWHGLMHKQGPGKLEICLHVEGKVLTCVITDNGVGRTKAEFFKSKSAEKKKSMGIKITTERLAMLNINLVGQNSFDVEDITDDKGHSAGTRVILKMHYRNLTEVCD